MLCRAAFPIEFEFTQDDVFGRRHVEGEAIGPGYAATLRPCPRVQGIRPGEVDVGFVAGGVMDEIEMAALRAGLLAARITDSGGT